MELVKDRQSACPKEKPPRIPVRRWQGVCTALEKRVNISGSVCYLISKWTARLSYRVPGSQTSAICEGGHPSLPQLWKQWKYQYQGPRHIPLRRGSHFYPQPLQDSVPMAVLVKPAAATYCSNTGNELRTRSVFLSPLISCNGEMRCECTHTRAISLCTES